MRKLILAILGVLIILGTYFLGNYLVAKNQKAKPKFKKQIKTVFVEVVENTSIPVILSASGGLIAKNKIELFSEVQGVLNPSSKAFKVGTRFDKGETLLSINSEEFYTSLQSEKSNLSNLIISILPDLRLDYPNQFKKWESYLKSFNIDKTVPKLPPFNSDKEKYFISGRNILIAYYNVKNLEVRLAKHQIKAPFSGILTETLLSPGTLVRVGQKLGEYIDPNIYEMEVAINSEFVDLLKVGNAVALSNLEKTKNYTGKIVRVNGKVDQVSQTIKVFIDIKHKDLKEGMFLEARVVVNSVAEAIEISRKLLIDNKGVYTVKNDSVLSLITVDPVYFSAEKVVIKGLKNNDKILSQILPGAFHGMIVKINKKK